MCGYLLAHDLGTSGNKAVLYDFSGNLSGSVVVGYPTNYPGYGWVEQDPDSWWKAVCQATKLLLLQTQIKASDIAAISFSGQMMGCLIVDQYGMPLYPMITWADTRSTKEADFMRAQIDSGDFYHKVGHRIGESYSAAKLLWIRNHVEDRYKRAFKLLNAKDYMIYRLTGNFVTDYSDASGTNLLDINSLQWSKDITGALGIDRNLLPDLHRSTDIVGYVTKTAAVESGLFRGTPVVAGGGDGSCACVGAGVTKAGSTYQVIGSSAWISTASQVPVYEEQMRTFNWVHLDHRLYTPCGTMQTAGYCASWFKENLMETCQGYPEMEEMLLRTVPGSDRLLFLPYLLGERSPLWDSKVRGAYIGLTLTHTKADMLRAVYEGAAYNLCMILEILKQQCSVDEIITIGGGAKSNVWLQIMADVYEKDLLIPRYLEEATCMGAAVCAGVGVGVYESFDVIHDFNGIERRIKPDSRNKVLYSQLKQAFQQSYRGLTQTYGLLDKIDRI